MEKEPKVEEKTLDEINRERLERLQQAEQTEVKREVEVDEKAEAEAYDYVTAMLEGADKTRKIDVTVDGGFLEYKPLTYGDFLKIQKIDNESERRIKGLYLMLHPTNPEITEEMIRGANQNHIQQIMAAIAADDNRFLLPALSKLYKSLALQLTREKSGKSATTSEKPPENSEP